jgi:hypothetical protein
MRRCTDVGKGLIHEDRHPQLQLNLRAFIDDLDCRLATVADLYNAINQKFEKAGITIVFVQRDLHLDTREPLRVTLGRSGKRWARIGFGGLPLNRKTCPGQTGTRWPPVRDIHVK